MIDTLAHAIQVALTPVFLLSAIAGLLSVFSTRLARVADRVYVLSEKVADLPRPVDAAGVGPEGARAAAKVAAKSAARAARLAGQLAHLRRRSWHLELAVAMGAVAAALTCLVILLIFFGPLGDATLQAVLTGTFGLAVVSTMVSVVAFAVELLLASRGVRRIAEERQGTAEVRSGGAAPRAQHRA